MLSTHRLLGNSGRNFSFHSPTAVDWFDRPAIFLCSSNNWFCFHFEKSKVEVMFFVYFRLLGPPQSYQRRNCIVVGCLIYFVVRYLSRRKFIALSSFKHPVLSSPYVNYVKQSRRESVTDAEQCIYTTIYERISKETAHDELRSTNADSIWKIPILFKYAVLAVGARHM